MGALGVRPWTREEFLASRGPWQELLARSAADPLFMSWDWLACWWSHHAGPLRAELCVLGVYSPAGELQGIAPFYLHPGSHRGLFRTRRLELLGCAWRDPDAVFSEYLDLLALPGSGDAVCEAVQSWLRADPGWDELVLCNLAPGSLAARLGQACGAAGYLRTVDSLTGWSAVLPADFAAFTASLSSNTRRKALHQRDKLAAPSCARVERAGRAAALAQLERFVAQRYRRATTADARARFHADLVARLADESVRLTELRSGDQCVSVMLNLRAGGTEYYLMSGFDPAYARGLSPGYLHLGFAIEAACRDGVRRFDFLAGRGLHRDYKRDFPVQATELRSLHLVRKPSLRTLFRISDRLRGSGKMD
jgi:CelD/BcsL family acetyltransferase involved in cellulose biosynthesis